eukprot:TRINITY_DN2109_c1_g2_i1.p1 TRINITY_DN2109_c1_g2~~TRINITY_DN2109_c1_g2_i1.p1  ORF type:complete len:186 (+),score=17.25 TRINITY_DN2109_c1_g2_i1:305-862(+)
MATAVLHPRDCLAYPERCRPFGTESRKKPSKGKAEKEAFERRRSQKEPSSSAAFSNSSSRRRCHRNAKPNPGEDLAKALTAGQVTLLKRGEPLRKSGGNEEERRSPAQTLRRASASSKSKTTFPLALPMAKGAASEEWAGPAFVNSPSPRCLPLPKFSVKKSGNNAQALIDPCATESLRRLLGLD